MSDQAAIRPEIIEGLDEILGEGWRETMDVEWVLAAVEREAPHLRRYALALCVDDDLAEGLADASEEEELGYSAYWLRAAGDGCRRHRLVAEAFYWRWKLEREGGELGP